MRECLIFWILFTGICVSSTEERAGGRAERKSIADAVSLCFRIGIENEIMKKSMFLERYQKDKEEVKEENPKDAKVFKYMHMFRSNIDNNIDIDPEDGLWILSKGEEEGMNWALKNKAEECLLKSWSILDGKEGYTIDLSQCTLYFENRETSEKQDSLHVYLEDILKKVSLIECLELKIEAGEGMHLEKVMRLIQKVKCKIMRISIKEGCEAHSVEELNEENAKMASESSKNPIESLEMLSLDVFSLSLQASILKYFHKAKLALLTINECMAAEVVFVMEKFEWMSHYAIFIKSVRGEENESLVIKCKVQDISLCVAFSIESICVSSIDAVSLCTFLFINKTESLEIPWNILMEMYGTYIDGTFPNKLVFSHLKVFSSFYIEDFSIVPTWYTLWIHAEKVTLVFESNVPCNSKMYLSRLYRDKIFPFYCIQCFSCHIEYYPNRDDLTNTLKTLKDLGHLDSTSFNVSCSSKADMDKMQPISIIIDFDSIKSSFSTIKKKYFNLSHTKRVFCQAVKYKTIFLGQMSSRYKYLNNATNSSGDNIISLLNLMGNIHAQKIVLKNIILWNNPIPLTEPNESDLFILHAPVIVFSNVSLCIIEGFLTIYRYTAPTVMYFESFASNMSFHVFNLLLLKRNSKIDRIVILENNEENISISRKDFISEKKNLWKSMVRYNDDMCVNMSCFFRDEDLEKEKKEIGIRKSITFLMNSETFLHLKTWKIDSYLSSISKNKKEETCVQRVTMKLYAVDGPIEEGDIWRAICWVCVQFPNAQDIKFKKFQIENSDFYALTQRNIDLSLFPSLQTVKLSGCSIKNPDETIQYILQAIRRKWTLYDICIAKTFKTYEKKLCKMIQIYDKCIILSLSLLAELMNAYVESSDQIALFITDEQNIFNQNGLFSLLRRVVARDEVLICANCQEDMVVNTSLQPEDVIVLQCGHAYHIGCISHWYDVIKQNISSHTLYKNPQIVCAQKCPNSYIPTPVIRVIKKSSPSQEKQNACTESEKEMAAEEKANLFDLLYIREVEGMDMWYWDNPLFTIWRNLCKWSYTSKEANISLLKSFFC
ncbi:hypothetical protein NEFER03_0976 [Nematocida sp. LUAm3]|nr:hypothetical protein NEFER03_0976 [Nematocida sp. LUAm3]KAI5175420.1 hypothetical protein NEFER02_1349 [Nematocida sp. LUAm2]KAI5177623.1 hypothetical protein NEFER01_0847 [Nematocida sp. LUAm1]